MTTAPAARGESSPTSGATAVNRHSTTDFKDAQGPWASPTVAVSGDCPPNGPHRVAHDRLWRERMEANVGSTSPDLDSAADAAAPLDALLIDAARGSVRRFLPGAPTPPPPAGRRDTPGPPDDGPPPPGPRRGGGAGGAP